MTDHAQIRSSLHESRLDRFAPLILELAAPCLRLRLRRDTVAVGASKVGGAPDLAPDMRWPRVEGQDLTFIAQIDLGEVVRALPSELPSSGLLSFFFDRSDFYTGERACRVFHIAGAVARRACPSELETASSARADTASCSASTTTKRPICCGPTRVSARS